MVDPTVAAVALLAVLLATGLFLAAPQIATQGWVGFTIVVRAVILLGGLAALATGQLVAGGAILFLTTLWVFVERPDEEVL